jgi:hypothetical protein
MRKAAGILMIIYGVKTISIYAAAVINESLFSYLGSSAISFFWAVPAIIVGVVCLKRRDWGFCFAYSLLLFMWVIFNWGTLGLGPNIFASFEVLIRLNPVRLADTILSMPLGILPLIFICVRRNEWQEISDSVDYEVSNGG